MSTQEGLALDLLYYGDKVNVLNPQGHVGILTLWSRTDVVLKKMAEKMGGIPPCIAAVSNLYGDGISQLLVNLLYNPQISHLYIIGNNRTDSATELLHYFSRGVEEITINNSTQYRIKDTTRLVNSALADPTLFDGRRPIVGAFCHPFNKVDGERAPSLDRQIETLHYALSHIKPPEFVPERKVVTLAEPKITIFPSVQAGHQIISDNPLDAWGELLFLIQRFGLPTKLAKGDRKELLNLKVVITNPVWMEEGEYEKYNLNKSRMRDYCKTMLDPHLEADTSYTYGNRLQEYFGYDMIERAIQRLSEDKEDRKSYLALWDARGDMEDRNLDGSPRGHPCWVGGFFRVYDGRLTLSVTFRTHRAYTAWVENVHGLMTLQQKVADRLGLPVGPLTVVSHSISIDPGQLPLVESIVAARKWKMRDDGRGEVVFSIDGTEGNKKVVAEHRMGGLVLKRYEGSNVEALGHQMAQDYLISDLNHALYIGRQLGKLQMCLKHGVAYEES